jgi:protein-disulfide isomerase
MNKKILVFSTVAVVLVGFALATYVFRNKEVSQVQQNAHLLLRADAARLGSPLAPVTIVEFFDPECETCRRFHPMTKMLLQEFDGKVQMIFRYAPFHANSKFAIQILEAARQQNRYWEVLDVLYQHQPEWGDHHNPRPELIWTYLTEVGGLDMARLKVDMNEPGIQKMIEQDLSDGRQLGVERTPQFFVNGEPLLNFGYEQLRQLVIKHIPST